MSASFIQGQALEDSDLNVYFYRDNLAFSPFFIKYELGYLRSNNFYEKLGYGERTPRELNTGRFAPNFLIGDKWKTGYYRIVWKYRVSEASELLEKYLDFKVCTEGIYETQGFFDLLASLVIIREGAWVDISGTLVIEV